MTYRIGIQLISFNKPKYLKQTLDSLMIVMGKHDKLCVLEQSDSKFKEECLNICKEYSDIHVIDIPENRGQRGATNVVYESSFFDDCDYVMITDHDNHFHEPLTTYCEKLDSDNSVWVATGYNSPEHDFERKDGEWLRKSSARAGHMVLRQKDFLKLCPIDEKFGTSEPDYGCAWFCGLDWWITHWCSQAPGHKRPEIIASYPGGVEHIGRESTWQGSYDDEYDMETNIWFRSASTYDIVKRFPPRHAYMNYKYWYEKVDVESLRDEGPIPVPKRPHDDDIIRLKKLVKDKLNVSLDSIDEHHFISPFKPSETKIVEPEVIEEVDVLFSESPIIAFNYLWPAYGFQFLEKSIKSVLPYVKRYILYLNEYSYVGMPCANKALSAVKSILEQFDKSKVEVVFNGNKDHPKEVKEDNIGYYIQQTLDRTKGECDYIWYLSTDEVYDSHIAKDILNKAKNKEITNCIITQPICYVDNPHWFVNPPEDFTRPSIIPNIPNINVNKKTLDSSLTFHHCSFVLTREEVESKFGNWGHRNDVKGQKGRQFLKTFDEMKTNKYIHNFHPVQPSLYKTVAFSNDNIHQEMFMDWVYHLLQNTKYDDQSCVNTLPAPGLTKDLFFPFTHSERRFISIVMSNFIPKNGNFLEIGSRVGWTSIMSHLVSDVNFVGVESNIDDYSFATSNLIKTQSPMNITFGTVKQIVPKFPNDRFDALFVNISNDPEAFREAIIEVWPKLKDFSIIFGVYDKSNKAMVDAIFSIINRAVQIQCPWGTELFRTYELYYDIFKSIEDYKNVKYDTQYSMWFARLRKS